VNPYTGVIIL